MRILITGGAGFIGSHLGEALVESGNHVVCLDNFNDYYDPAVKRQNIAGLIQNSAFQLVEGDILDWPSIETLFKESSFDCVVHLAARAGVRPSLEQPRLYQQVNVEGTTNLLELSAKNGVKKFVMASSSSVYGNNKKVPFSEDDPVDHPISPYAATKKACELLGYTYHSLYQLPVTCLRFFTVYGPRQRPDMAIHKFTRLIAENRPIPFFGDGSSRRDYTYISDIVDGIIKSIERCKDYHIYNLGESQTISLSDMIAIIENALGKKATLNRLPNQPGDVNCTFADISRAQKELNYDPGVPVRQGIPAFVEWFLENLEKNG